MSRQNVETVRRVYAAWNASGDGRGMFPFLSEEFEIVNPGYAIESGTRRGLQGALTALEALEGAFADYSHEPWELIDAEDKVLALVTFRARGRQGGVEVEALRAARLDLEGRQSRASRVVPRRSRGARGRRPSLAPLTRPW